MDIYLDDITAYTMTLLVLKMKDSYLKEAIKVFKQSDEKNFYIEDLIYHAEHYNSDKMIFGEDGFSNKEIGIQEIQLILRDINKLGIKLPTEIAIGEITYKVADLIAKPKSSGKMDTDSKQRKRLSSDSDDDDE